MRIHVQRVTSARVNIAGDLVASIDHGMLALVGFAPQDDHQTVDAMLKKLLACRLFADRDGKANLNLFQSGGALLLVPQFTLYADTSRGTRPGYSHAAAPAHASALFDYCVATARDLCTVRATRVEQGQFGAQMQVSLVNDGPFTLLLEA